jgi:two-component system cell cycle sensor histidine kinase/response regulator CckA
LPEDLKERKTILVADDQEAIRTLVSAVLSQSGYNVLVAETGEDALQQSKTYPGIIHLLLSNIQMPGMTGIELATQISLERPDILVLLMSGFSSGMLVLNEGWHFLHKPFIPAQLRDLVDRLLIRLEPAGTKQLDEHQDLKTPGSSKRVM